MFQADHERLNKLISSLHSAQRLLSDLAALQAEKTAKAVWYHLGLDPWGHSVQRLLADLPADKGVVPSKSLKKKAAALDRFHIPTRYPNGLPDLTPSDNYFRSDAEQALSCAKDIIATCRRILKG
jgi:HEPN domain-containing protein